MLAACKMKRSAGSSSLLFLAAVLVQFAAPVASQGCPLPTAGEINVLLQSQLSGSGNPGIITLLNYNFPCLAVNGRDRYRHVSVATNYTVGNMTFTAQFQLRCSSNGESDRFFISGTEQSAPPAAFTVSRRDCWTCAPNQLDPITQCLGELCTRMYFIALTYIPTSVNSVPYQLPGDGAGLLSDCGI